MVSVLHEFRNKRMEENYMEEKKLKPIQWIYGYCKKHLWTVSLLAGFSALIAGSFILLVLVSSRILDIASGNSEGSFLFYTGMLAVIIAFQAVLNILSSNLKVRVSGKLEMQFKQAIFSSILKKSYLEVAKLHSGEIINRLTSDIDILVNGIVGIFPQMISLGTKLIVGLLVLFRIDFSFTFLILTIGMLMCVGSRIYSRKFRYLHKEVQETSGVVRSFLQECIENLIVIKSFSNESWIGEQLSAHQQKNYQKKIKRNTISNLANTTMYVMFTAGYYAALVWGAVQISRGILTFGTLTAFLQIIGQIRAPFRNISGLIPQYYSMLASAERLMELEELSDELRQNEISHPHSFYEKMQAIVFENVSFSYEDGAILKDFSVRIEKGSLNAVVGTSGKGKSTMMKLLLGLISCDKGKIYFENQEEKVLLDAGSRNLFAYVPQGNFILSGTICENITFSNQKATEADIISAAKTACIWEYIKELPKGLDTILKERGSGLSEGQIQRLAIARAILSDAPILLLDECTSALDEETERKVLKNLKKLHTKTILCISHKAAAIHCCDTQISL